MQRVCPVGLSFVFIILLSGSIYPSLILGIERQVSDRTVRDSLIQLKDSDSTIDEKKRLITSITDSSNKNDLFFSIAADTNFNLNDSLITAVADSQYVISSIREFFMGSHYRDSWATPIKVPVVKFNGEDGGYTLLDVEPGTQTETFFAEDQQGEKFAFRTLNKDLELFIPKYLRQNFIVGMVQDQVSATYPYAKLITSPLAKAAGIYSTEAEVVYIFRPEKVPSELLVSPGNLAIKEEFVSASLVRKNYGHHATEQIFSTSELLEYLPNHPQKKIDQSFLLKTRLFDMLINDWHRHEGQFRWIEIERNKGRNLIRPFPIDRDNAFLLTDGLLPSLGTKKWGVRKFQNFGSDIRDIKGMNYVARYLDRRFMNTMTQDEWIKVAEELQSALTDSVIEQSVNNLPDELYKLRGPFFIKRLKERRDRLTEFAGRYFDVVAKKIDLLGTHHPDHFVFEYDARGNLRIIKSTAADESLPPDTLIVDHEFTDEIRVFGLDGSDTFEFNIATKLPLTVHLIGGNGNKDTYIREDLSGLRKSVMTQPVEIPRKEDAEIEPRTEEITREMMNKYGYNYQEFEYDKTSPLFDFSINADDGLFLGSGVVLTNYGFRKYPYSAKHTISGNAAFSNGSFNINYQGTFIRALGKADLLVESNVSVPNSRTNFFGFGNDTEEVRDADFHSVRIDQVVASIMMRYRLTSGINFLMGPFVEFFDPVRVEDRFVNTPESGLGPDDFDFNPFAGIEGRFALNYTDGGILRKNGVTGRFGAKLTQNFNDMEPFLKLNAEFRLYKYVDKLNTTFATRMGGIRNVGRFEFFQANTLGGQVSSGLNEPLLNSSNFRGTLRHRFSGRTVFHHNSEARIPLFTIDKAVIPGEMGLLVLADHGRVWNSDLNSNTWHYSTGGGIWYNAFNQFVINATWAKSDVDQLLTVEIGFMF